MNKRICWFENHKWKLLDIIHIVLFDYSRKMVCCRRGKSDYLHKENKLDRYICSVIRHKYMLVDKHHKILYYCSKNKVVHSQCKHCFCIKMEFTENMRTFFQLHYKWILMDIINIFLMLDYNLILMDKRYIYYHPIRVD